jgi:hypothetical protein
MKRVTDSLLEKRVGSEMQYLANAGNIFLLIPWPSSPLVVSLFRQGPHHF